LTKTEQLKFERLQRLLEAERQRAEKAWEGYRDTLYQLVEVQMQLDQIKKVMEQWKE
jgi:hypothetical protein